MGHCRTVGDVRETSRHGGVHLEWEIPNFFSLPDAPDCIFFSPDFSCAGADWYLIVYPNGQAYCASQGWVVLFLCRRLCSPQRAVRFGLGIRGADGTEEDLLRDLRLPEGCTHLRVNEFLLRSDLLKRRHHLAPSDALRVTCTMYGDGTPGDNILMMTDGDDQKPTSVQLKFNHQMDENARTDNIFTCSDEQKPTRVQFQFKEQTDEDTKTGNKDNTQEMPIKDTPDKISRNKAKSLDKDKGVPRMQRAFKRAAKYILRYAGKCVGRPYY